MKEQKDMNETLRIINERRSTRAFSEGKVGDDMLQAIVEAGLYAPSGMNLQPWHFTAALVKKLGIPEGYRPLKAIALGYRRQEPAGAPPRRADTVNYIKEGIL